MIRQSRLTVRFPLALALMFFGLVDATLSFAADSDVAQCAKEKAAFDGIKPLKYETVTSEKGTHVNLYKEHPALCSKGDESTCKGKAYLVPSNVVAVANTCGDYAHVQFIAEKTVSYGWVLKNELSIQSRQLPYDDGLPGGKEVKRDYPLQFFSSQIHVALTKGKGIPVCEAYLQRLNQTVFHQPPYCGRPENDQVPGFDRLNRVPLSASEVNRLTIPILNLVYFPRPHYVPAPNPSESGFLDIRGFYRPLPDDAQTSVWRFQAEVDIDNDGVTDDLILWRGDQGTWKYDGCGLDDIHRGGGLQVAFLLDRRDQSVDEQSTAAIFEHPRGGYFLTDHAGKRYVAKTFRPIGFSMGILKYHGTTYFDTFLSSSDEPLKMQGKFRNELHVYVNRHRQTRELCEFTNLDPQWEMLP